MYYKLAKVGVTNWGSSVLLQLGRTLLQVGTASLLQIGGSVATNWGSYYNLGKPFYKIGRYYKLGKNVLQIGAGITN